MSLNGDWEFGAGDAETFERRITVPFCPQSQLSGVGVAVPGDVVWYRRRFAAPEAARLLLHFGAVDYRATVWVNGEEVARHEGGHTPFSADITAVVRDGDNVVVVRAEDPLADRTIPRGKQYWLPEPESIFYTATTGIWQTVWLEPVPNRFIADVRVRPNFDDGAVDFELAAEGMKEVTVTFGGEAVGRWEGSTRGGRISLEVGDVHSWSPEAPHLYGLEARLLDDHGNALDLVSSYFGMRKVEAKDGRFWLNGRPYVQRLVLDQGYFPGGLLTAGADADLRRDIELAKAMGFNGARKHQKIEDPRWLYWTDTLGFLVWGEMPDFHEATPLADARLEAEWREAVVRDRDHPSIVAWVPINESFGLKGLAPLAMAELLNRLRRITLELDDTRLVMSNDGWEHTVSDLCTLHDYEGGDALRARYSSLQAALDPRARPLAPYLPGYSYRGEPVVVSEFGGVALTGTGGFGWSEVESGEQLLATYGDLVDALMAPGPVEGFCYTQLTDIEQERNGLLTFDRLPKVAPELLRPITQAPKRSSPGG